MKSVLKHFNCFHEVVLVTRLPVALEQEVGQLVERGAAVWVTVRTELEGLLRDLKSISERARVVCNREVGTEIGAEIAET